MTEEYVRSGDQLYIRYPYGLFNVYSNGSMFHAPIQDLIAAYEKTLQRDEEDLARAYRKMS
jgi:hypothetical protein